MVNSLLRRLTAHSFAFHKIKAHVLSAFVFQAQVLRASVLNTRHLIIRCTAFGISFLWVISAVQAQDLEPRSYTNLPIGLNFAALGYLHSEGEVSPSPGAAISDASLTIDTLVLAYARTFSLAERSAKLDLALARSCFQGSAMLNGERVEADRCGYNDPSVKLTWNFYGAPAMDAKTFASWQQGIVLGTSIEITAPLGSYQSEYLLNAGANRWIFRPGLGLSHKLGRWYYNLSASVRLYGDNASYLGDTRLAQEPQTNLQAHLIYTFSPGHWLALNANYFFGGETSKNGLSSGDGQNNSRFGLTYSLALTARSSIKLNASTGVLTRFGNDFDSLGAFWLYRF